jgi:hypothetical protein
MGFFLQEGNHLALDEKFISQHVLQRPAKPQQLTARQYLLIC